MQPRTIRHTAVFLFLLVLLAAATATACRQPAPAAANLPTLLPPAIFTPVPSLTPPPTLTPGITPSPPPTVTPSPSPTPTATAVPLTVRGNPRAAQLANLPAPQRASSCGIVDILDFPLDPPDALNVSRGGGDFGVFRDRYGKYHAGEDWRAPGEGSSFGKPVYSIGNGRVMYAEPEGWNRDKGVVIIEHIFADGRSFYSFYGHLDPPSVILQPGECVQRGQTVGNIGKPRTSPHLHFEIRTHMPYAPGPGYWPEDPTTAGWLPPSQTIWNERMAGAPGVVWLRPFLPSGITPLGQPDEQTFLLRVEEQVASVGLADGRFQPLVLDGAPVNSAVLSGEWLVAANRQGQVRAFLWPEAQPAWTLDLGVSGALALWPLPGGGVVAGLGTRLWGLVDGQIVWAADVGARPLAMAVTDDTLLLSTGGSDGALWAVSGANPPEKLADFSGYPVASGRAIWLIGTDGVYRLVDGAWELVLPLPTAALRGNTAVALPDGGLLLAHSNAAGRRLMALNPDGSLRWERSFAGVIAGEVALLAAGEDVYLAAQSANGAASEMKIYTVDEETAVLTHIFTGGTRAGGWGEAWGTAVGDKLLLNTGGGSLLVLDPQLAQALVAAGD
ncbi:MAG: peptidoglycan DD-metalloendopeptidase family protein [Ardenticatenaceae bacterium]|nr:peptidoglycan DD-metalloendopeptidase family protein [Ardenticatenaceae bacterium]MCB8986750.1 peptidoglycan DD-metalloendopeptidase family protein [Ardenticatenaceae bacterium]